MNDPAALNEKGISSFSAGDYATAVECWEKAAGLGHIGSHVYLSMAYEKGCGVEIDMKKYTHHLELAAIGGHPLARYNLGCDMR